MTKSDNFIEPWKTKPLRRRCGPESAALPLTGRRLNGQPKEPPAPLFAGRCGRAVQTKAIQRFPFPPLVAQTRGREGPQTNVRPRKGKPMPTRGLSARALSGNLCVAGADQNRLLRRPVPPSVAQTRGSEGPQINVRLRGWMGSSCQCTP